MSQKGAVALTAENNNILAQTNPESITPQMVCQMWQDIIDSMYNNVDDDLTPPPISLSVSQLATAIGGSALNDKQWILVTGRTDSYPLWVQCVGTNNIAPQGVWIKAGKVCAVTMDYINGYDGQTNPFIATFDAATQRLFLTQVSGQANVGIKTILSVTASVSWTGVTNNGSQTQNITVQGAAVGDVVNLGIDNAATGGLVWYQAWVSAANNVTIECYNLSVSTINPTGTFTVQIIK